MPPTTSENPLEWEALSLGLPPSVAEAQRGLPVEEVALAILREKHPELAIYTLLPWSQESNANWAAELNSTLTVRGGILVLVRHIAQAGIWGGRPGLLDKGLVAVHVYTKDPNGEDKGAMVSKALRDTLVRAACDDWYRPDIGALKGVRVDETPNRKTDWATASGPVQFADLPTGYWRTEGRYTLTVRPPAVWQ